MFPLISCMKELEYAILIMMMKNGVIILNVLKKINCYLIIISMILILSVPVYAKSPNISGASGILMERNSGRILYKNNINKKLPMASTTKIMTALVALENGNLDDIVKIDKNSVGVEGSSIYLYKGEKISLEDLLYGLMLRSGNDSAVAIANHIGGSVDNFIKMMNKKAKEIGAYKTNFTNPHGLHNNNHYTTAYDLALITRAAMKNRKFRDICKTKLWVSNREKNKYFYNKNKTLWQYGGGDGVKIGYTRVAGRCLVSSATKDNMQLIAVVLNDYSWFNDCYNLFDYGFKNYTPMVIYSQDQYIRSIPICNGKKGYVPIVAGKDFIIPLTDGEKGKIKTIIKSPENLNAPVSKGQKIGKIEAYLNGNLIGSAPLLTNRDIKEKGTFDKIMDYIKNIF